MTREEAQKEGFKQAIIIGNGYSSDGLSTLLDKIYDDFEIKNEQVVKNKKTYLTEPIDNSKLKQCNTYYTSKDRSLPYVFDLHYDIKSEAALLHALMNGTNFDNPIVDIEDLANEYGYNRKWLETKYKETK